MISSVENWGKGRGGGGGWLSTSSIFTDVGATGSTSAVTCYVIYCQHSNINIFAWLQPECGMQHVSVSITIHAMIQLTSSLINRTECISYHLVGKGMVSTLHMRFFFKFVFSKSTFFNVLVNVFNTFGVNIQNGIKYSAAEAGWFLTGNGVR